MSIATEINRQKARHMIQNDQRLQLCWMCTKAVASDGCNCSWSKDMEPVSGWTATETFDKGMFRYHVTGCPEFVPDEPVWAVAMSLLTSGKKYKLPKLLDTGLHKQYGVIEDETARFILRCCAEHGEELKKSGYNYRRGLETAAREPAGDYHEGVIKKPVGRPKKKQRGYIDENAASRGGCKMRDCIYSGMLTGSALVSEKSKNLCCDYISKTGHMRTKDGKHQIVNGRCDLYQRDMEKRRKQMEDRKKYELKQLKAKVDKANEEARA